MVAKTEKRKGPTDSATKYKVGTKKIGNDGNMWIIISTQSGTHRWKKIGTNSTMKKSTTMKKKGLTTSSSNKTVKSKGDISVEHLKKLKKKYSVTTSGSKKDIAAGLWRVRGRAMETGDIEMILPLLHRDQVKDAEKLIKERSGKVITNYRGMWKPQSKAITKMSRDELIKELRLFRNAWERITTRHQDLSDERLKDETTDELRNLIKFYYSNEGKMIAEDWLRDYK